MTYNMFALICVGILVSACMYYSKDDYDYSHIFDNLMNEMDPIIEEPVIEHVNGNDVYKLDDPIFDQYVWFDEYGQIIDV